MAMELRRVWPAPTKDPVVAVDEGGVRGMVEGSAVVVVGRKGCCMSHVARRLLQGLGVNPTVCEIGEGSPEEIVLMDEIAEMDGGDARILAASMFPVVFIGGKLVGGLDRLMAVHISGELVPILKEAGALWL
ncbi:Glutaredoxin-like plant II protein [Dioscorea alata]|uniref:Glutaredoxin-like plant II protein n=1 Tax=Dioscorea alata TaxID=55571 RepID=A0ACB7WDQ5_DIOAL|nr:Glutaredoxin-like plant II protein [Dioscorea alata]